MLQDTQSDLQPFGVAGETKLVRFGTWGYDLYAVRWLAKDPIGFGGGDGNLYAYVGNDPGYLNFSGEDQRQSRFEWKLSYMGDHKRYVYRYDPNKSDTYGYRPNLKRSIVKQQPLVWKHLLRW